MGSIAISKVKDFLINGVQAISISSSDVYMSILKISGQAMENLLIWIHGVFDVLPLKRKDTSITIYKPCWFILDTSITKFPKPCWFMLICKTYKPSWFVHCLFLSPAGFAPTLAPQSSGLSKIGRDVPSIYGDNVISC